MERKNASDLMALTQRVDSLERQEIAALRAEIRELQQSIFQWKMRGGAAVLAVIMVCGAAIFSIPKKLAHTFVETETRAALDRFERQELPALVDRELRAQEKVVAGIYLLQEQARRTAAAVRLDAERATATANQAEQTLAGARKKLADLESARLESLTVRRLDLVDAGGRSRAALSIEGSRPYLLLQDGIVELRGADARRILLEDHRLTLVREDGATLIVGGTVNGLPSLTQLDRTGRRLWEGWPSRTSF
jgi:hypothetical protein